MSDNLHQIGLVRLGKPQTSLTRRDGTQAATVGGGNRWQGKIYHTVSEAFAAFGEHNEIVQGWFPDVGVTFLVAEKQAAKTLLGMGLALSLATDQKEWMGFPIMPGYTAIYLTGEAPQLAAHHWKAWLIHNGFDPESTAPRFHMAGQTPELLNKEDINKLIPQLRALLPPNAKPVIFVDTLQRATPGVEMNSSGEMSIAVENLELLGREMKAPVLLIAHPPKSGGSEAAGSSVLGNMSVAMWEMHCVRPEYDNRGKLKKQDCKGNPTSIRNTSVTRNKGQPRDAEFVAKIVTVPIGGNDPYGQPKAGGVLVRVDPPEVTATGKGKITTARRDISDNAKAVMTLLQAEPTLSRAKIAQRLGWLNSKREDDRSKVQRAQEELKRHGMAAGEDSELEPAMLAR